MRKNDVRVYFTLIYEDLSKDDMLIMLILATFMCTLNNLENTDLCDLRYKLPKNIIDHHIKI